MDNSRHVVRRADEAAYEPHPDLAGHSSGLRVWNTVDEYESVHCGFGIWELAQDGRIDWHVHSYEQAVYLLSGEAVIDTDDGSFRLRPGDYGVVAVGAPHAWRGSGSGPARWAVISAPQPQSGREDTFFAAHRPPADDPMPVDPRDPRTRSFGHIDPGNMEVSRQTQDDLLQSASMRTALLVYSGITVKMMVDSDLGADLLTMFMVQYEPDGKAGAHDHPLEEAYFILDGEVDGTFDGQVYRLRPGDFAWAGVGCVHEFSNPGPGSVRWLETQTPQPPGRHSYRFARDWGYLHDVLHAE